MAQCGGFSRLLCSCGFLAVVAVLVLEGRGTKNTLHPAVLVPHRRLDHPMLAGEIQNFTRTREEAHSSQHGHREVEHSGWHDHVQSNASADKAAGQHAAPHDGLRPLPLVWSRASLAVAAFVVTSCGASLVCCFAVSLQGQTGALADFGLSRNSYFVYDPLDEDVGHLAKSLRIEARLMMLLPMIALFGISGTTCDEGPPTFLYFLYLPFLIRCKFLEYRWMMRLKVDGWQSSFAFPFALSALEHMDFFTDGLFPLQVYKCDPQVTDHFVESFQQSAASNLAPSVAYLHFWGISLLFLGVAVLSQQAAVSHSGESTAAADLAGMGALAKWSELGANLDSMSSVYIAIPKVLIENCSQLLLQASFFGLVFERTSDTSKIKLLVSMGLGLVSAFTKSSRQMFNWPSLFCSADCCICSIMLLSYVLPSLLSMFCVAWACAKLYYSFACDSHLWNITSGCVVL